MKKILSLLLIVLFTGSLFANENGDMAKIERDGNKVLHEGERIKPAQLKQIYIDADADEALELYNKGKFRTNIAMGFMGGGLVCGGLMLFQTLEDGSINVPLTVSAGGFVVVGMFFGITGSNSQLKSIDSYNNFVDGQEGDVVSFAVAPIVIEDSIGLGFAVSY